MVNAVLTRRKANEKYARSEEKKKGKRHVPQKEATRSRPFGDVSKTTLAILAFVIFGGGLLQLLYIFFA